MNVFKIRENVKKIVNHNDYLNSIEYIKNENPESYVIEANNYYKKIKTSLNKNSQNVNKVYKKMISSTNSFKNSYNKIEKDIGLDNNNLEGSMKIIIEKPKFSQDRYLDGKKQNNYKFENYLYEGYVFKKAPEINKEIKNIIEGILLDDKAIIDNEGITKQIYKSSENDSPHVITKTIKQLLTNISKVKDNKDTKEWKMIKNEMKKIKKSSIHNYITKLINVKNRNIKFKSKNNNNDVVNAYNNVKKSVNTNKYIEAVKNLNKLLSKKYNNIHTNWNSLQQNYNRKEKLNQVLYNLGAIYKNIEEMGGKVNEKEFKNLYNYFNNDKNDDLLKLVNIYFIKNNTNQYTPNYKKFKHLDFQNKKPQNVRKINKMIKKPKPHLYNVKTGKIEIFDNIFSYELVKNDNEKLLKEYKPNNNFNNINNNNDNVWDFVDFDNKKYWKEFINNYVKQNKKWKNNK